MYAGCVSEPLQLFHFRVISLRVIGRGVAKILIVP